MKKKSKKILIPILIVFLIFGSILFYYQAQGTGIATEGFPTNFILVNEQKANQNLNKLIGFEAEIKAVGSTSDDLECIEPPKLTVQDKQYSISIPNREDLIYRGSTELETQEIETIKKIEDTIDPSKFSKGISYFLNLGCSKKAEIIDLKFKMWVECKSDSHCLDIGTFSMGSCNEEYKCENYKILGIYSITEPIAEKTSYLYPLIGIILIVLFTILFIIYIYKNRK